MPRISTASLIAALWLVPAALAGPAFAFVQLAETLDSAAAASVQHDAAGLSQDHIKEIFFDAARQGRDDLLDGLIRSGMKPDERDAKGYTALILAAYNGQAKTVDLLIQKGANPCATDAKGNSSLMGVAFKENRDRTAPDRRPLRCECPQRFGPDGFDDGGHVRANGCRETAAHERGES
jgi:uncharacterized protein